jgi:predicted CDP-diglyceride synthetase/phosphatidate cytidylyltransferase
MQIDVSPIIPRRVSQQCIVCIYIKFSFLFISNDFFEIFFFFPSCFGILKQMERHILFNKKKERDLRSKLIFQINANI